MIVSNKTLRICERIREAGGKPYVVGGFVRDLILGRQPHDEDIVVVGMSPTTLRVALPDACWVEATNFPVLVQDGVEVALARTERKAGEGYTGFECETEGVTLEEDLRRRDLTWNAIAMDPFTGDIIDPCGFQADIRTFNLRAAGPHFGEDPLRVLRLARFAAQFTRPFGEYIATPDIDEGLMEQARTAALELHTLPGERVFMELRKALATDHPNVFFETLHEIGALCLVFPEINGLRHRIQPEKYHPEGDAYVHTLLVLQRARELGADDETMFAALVHDLGKAVTPDDNLPHHYNHEALGVPLVHQVCERLKVPKAFRDTAIAVTREHLNVHRFADLRAVKKVRLLKRLRGIYDDTLLRRLGLACQADAQGRGPDFIDKDYPQRAMILDAAATLRRVDGAQFSHLKSGRVIAQKIEQARMKALENAGFKARPRVIHE